MHVKGCSVVFGLLPELIGLLPDSARRLEFVHMIFNPVFRDAQALGKQLASQSGFGAQAGHDFFLGSFLGSGIPFIFLIQKRWPPWKPTPA